MKKFIVKGLIKFMYLPNVLLLVLFVSSALIWMNAFRLRTPKLTASRGKATANPINTKGKGATKSIHADVNLRERTELFVLVLSDRTSFENREMIRQTWGRGKFNVFFMVGARYCKYPPEQRVQGICVNNSKLIPNERLHNYQDQEEERTKNISREIRTVLLPVSDDKQVLWSQIKESYEWVLKSTTAAWILVVRNDTFVRFKKLENYLRRTVDPEERNIFGPASEEPKQGGTIRAQNISNVIGHVVSWQVAQDFVNDINPFLEQIDSYKGISMINESIPRYQLRRIVSNKISNNGDCNDMSKLYIGGIASLKALKTCFQIIPGQKALKTVTENPSNHLFSARFDVVVKTVYAFYYSLNKSVPRIIEHVYTEHLRVWNHFIENCAGVQRWWFDAKRPCKNKRTASDFISSFHKTIESIKENGFASNISRIPVGMNGFPYNGAHRVSAAVALSKNATFQYFDSENIYVWNYEFFQKCGLRNNLTDFIVLEWMRIQLKLPNLMSKVYILTLFSTESFQKDKRMRYIVRTECSRDSDILYETKIRVNKHGMGQLITHMYGKQPWLKAKINELYSLFQSSTHEMRFLFFFGNDQENLKKCKYNVRKLYNHKNFKSSAHIPDTPKESLILAEMILNPNSVQFLNYGDKGDDCFKLAEELARRSQSQPVNTLPGIFIGRDDIMIDSGSVLHLFNLRKGTDVDVLFLNDIDKRILGKQGDFRIEAHAFKSNAISLGRAWGEDHFGDIVETKWDLFYDPNNYGFCYGIKFVSLEQLVRYKRRRNEPKKDETDVNLIMGLLTRQ